MPSSPSAERKREIESYCAPKIEICDVSASVPTFMGGDLTQSEAERKHGTRGTRGQPPRPPMRANLFRLRDNAKVRFRRLPTLRKFLFGFLVRYCRQDDDVVSLLPVYRRGNLVFRRQLNRIKNPQHFVEIAAGAHRVAEHQLDLLVWTDHEHCPYRRIGCRRTAFGSGSGIGRQHVIKLRNFELRVANQWVIHRMTLGLFNVFGPLSMTSYRVHTQAENLGVALRELGLKSSHVSKFGRAHRSEVFRVRKQDRPTIADPLMETDRSLCGFGRKIRRLVVYA